MEAKTVEVLVWWRASTGTGTGTSRSCSTCSTSGWRLARGRRRRRRLTRRASTGMRSTGWRSRRTFPQTWLTSSSWSECCPSWGESVCPHHELCSRDHRHCTPQSCRPWSSSTAWSAQCRSCYSWCLLSSLNCWSCLPARTWPEAGWCRSSCGRGRRRCRDSCRCCLSSRVGCWSPRSWHTACWCSGGRRLRRLRSWWRRVWPRQREERRNCSRILTSCCSSDSTAGTCCSSLRRESWVEMMRERSWWRLHCWRSRYQLIISQLCRSDQTFHHLPPPRQYWLGWPANRQQSSDSQPAVNINIINIIRGFTGIQCFSSEDLRQTSSRETHLKGRALPLNLLFQTIVLLWSNLMEIKEYHMEEKDYTYPWFLLQYYIF